MAPGRRKPDTPNRHVNEYRGEGVRSSPDLKGAAAKGRTRMTRRAAVGFALVLHLLAIGCAGPQSPPAVRPNVSPSSQPATAAEGGMALEGTRVGPMYRELLAVDLPAVGRGAGARNIDIRQARERVVGAQGRYESSLGAIFPVFAPSVSYEHLQGSVRAVNGPLLAADFNAFFPSALIQWAINPGRVYYDIVAARKRLDAAEGQEQSVVMDTVRAAAVQYYDLALAQAKLAAAQKAVSEAEELLRLTRLRVGAGAGLRADELRAESAVAARRQDLALAMNDFYQASVTLAVTLHLDPAVTLVPRPDPLPAICLVREELDLGRLLAIALAWRPDLRGVRDLAAAAAAEGGSTAWGNLGPQVQVGYKAGAISTQTPQRTTGLHEQEQFFANAGWALGLSTFGQIKTANAAERQARLEADRQLDLVRARVARAGEESAPQPKLIPMARQQAAAAEEALRLAQANLRAGTMLTLDVLQAEDAVDEARLRHATAVARYNQAQVNLLAAVGLIDPASLFPPNTPESPSAPPATAPATGPDR